MCSVTYPGGTQICIDTIISDARASLAGLSGKPSARTALPHISRLEHNRIKCFVSSIHTGLAAKGCFFQFFELFMAKASSAPLDGLGKAYRPESLPQLFHSSAIKYVGGGDPKKAYEPLDPSITSKVHECHHSRLSLSDISKRISELALANDRYMEVNAPLAQPDLSYEFFRFFCVCTLYTFLTEPEAHAFPALGISEFFGGLVRNDVSSFFGLIRNEIKKMPKGKLQRCFEGSWNSRFDPAAAGDLTSAEAGLLKHLCERADWLAMITLRRRRTMPLDCFRVFFGFSTNEYPTWVASASLSSPSQRQVHRVHPDEDLRDEAGALHKTVNFASYQPYARIFEKSMMVGDPTPNLGVMLIAPFQAQIGPFVQFGFFRAMRRLRECPHHKHKFRILDSKEYSEYYKPDSDVLRHISQSFTEELKTLGHRNNKGGDELFLVD